MTRKLISKYIHTPIL